MLKRSSASSRPASSILSRLARVGTDHDGWKDGAIETLPARLHDSTVTKADSHSGAPSRARRAKATSRTAGSPSRPTARAPVIEYSAGLSGLNKPTIDKLARLGIARRFDFVLHLPLRYDDETRIFAINEAPAAQERARRRPRRRVRRQIPPAPADRLSYRGRKRRAHAALHEFLSEPVEAARAGRARAGFRRNPAGLLRAGDGPSALSDRGRQSAAPGFADAGLSHDRGTRTGGVAAADRARARRVASFRTRCRKAS